MHLFISSFSSLALTFHTDIHQQPFQIRQHRGILKPDIQFLFHLFSFALILVIALVDVPQVFSLQEPYHVL